MAGKLSLYEVSEDLTALLDSLDCCETPEQRASCELEIQQAAEAQVRKVDSFCQYLAHLESQVELAAAEIERLGERKGLLSNKVDRLKSYAVRLLEAQPGKTLKGDTNTLTLRQNAATVAITNLEAVPAKFKTVETVVTIDKRAIRKALNAGEDVPGADLAFGSVSLVRR